MLILFKRRSIYLSLKIDSNLVISEPPSKSGGSQLRVQLCAVNSWNHGFFGCFGRSEEGNQFVIRAGCYSLWFHSYLWRSTWDWCHSACCLPPRYWRSRWTGPRCRPRGCPPCRWACFRARRPPTPSCSSPQSCRSCILRDRSPVQILITYIVSLSNVKGQAALWMVCTPAHSRAESSSESSES